MFYNIKGNWYTVVIDASRKFNFGKTITFEARENMEIGLSSKPWFLLLWKKEGSVQALFFFKYFP